MTAPRAPPGSSSSAPRTRPASTVVSTSAVLFSLTGSTSVAVTNALLCRVPAALPVTLSVIVADALTASVPSAHVTVRFCTVQLPWVADGGRERHADGQRIGHDDAGRGGRSLVLGEQRPGERRAERDRVGRLASSSRNRSADGGAAGTVTHAENSDVSLVGLVAVAVTIVPAAAANSGIVALPLRVCGHRRRRRGTSDLHRCPRSRRRCCRSSGW